MSGIRDPETRRKLLTYTPPPSLQTTVDDCRSDESARNDEATLANNDQGHTKIDKVGKKTWQRGKTRNTTTSKHNHICGYCGKSVHETRDECPARRGECSICQKMGHWATCCRQNKNLLDILGKKKHLRAPRIKVDLHHNADDSFITTAQATPDTRAEATVAGLDVLKQIGLYIGNTCRPPEDTITAANGTSFECVGTVDLHIHAADTSMKETVLICKEQK